ncbi:hypothetical protein B0H16DRAFT_1455989 [Mycena metata]|uniref:Secreted protein n=1 Tax=Mycena metata TaxID=1033252 RepID=A0AAD7JFS2_9AGAR|nr:hypothetical protein B0H16DRAFT_1455989 [Mycena metata]
MLASFAVAVAVALVSFSTGTGAVLTNCAVCPPSLFYQGITWTLLASPGGENVVDCHYSSPLDPNSRPTCSYREADGHLQSTNTVGGPNGACPNPVAVVLKQACA